MRVYCVSHRDKIGKPFNRLPSDSVWSYIAPCLERSWRLPAKTPRQRNLEQFKLNPNQSERIVYLRGSAYVSRYRTSYSILPSFASSRLLVVTLAKRPNF